MKEKQKTASQDHKKIKPNYKKDVIFFWFVIHFFTFLKSTARKNSKALNFTLTVTRHGLRITIGPVYNRTNNLLTCFVSFSI